MIVLFTTDLDAQGTNLSDVTMVVHVGLPREPVSRRLGRMARAGMTGHSHWLMTDFESASAIKQLTDQPLARHDVQASESMVATVHHVMDAVDYKIRALAYKVLISLSLSLSFFVSSQIDDDSLDDCGVGLA
jgi:superfamily II DNA/RNA helicase